MAKKLANGAEDDSSVGADQSATVRARVLVASLYGACNDVIELDAALADTLAGIVDTDPAAVAYAESLTGK